MKNKLFVFAGKPGVGKTTVIKSLFPDEKIIDILPFVMQFQIDGDVPEEKTFLGYQAMYQHIAQHGDDLNVVEIGTNYPVLNISELQKLNQKYQVKIFLCDAAKETLRARAQQRGMRHSGPAFERRINRDFPNTFVSLLKDADLAYQLVDMEQPFGQLLNWFRQQINS